MSKTKKPKNIAETGIRINLHIDKFVHPELFSELVDLPSKSKAERVRLLASLALSAHESSNQSHLNGANQKLEGLAAISSSEISGSEEGVKIEASSNKKAPSVRRRSFSSKAKI